MYRLPVHEGHVVRHELIQFPLRAGVAEGEEGAALDPRHRGLGTVVDVLGVKGGNLWIGGDRILI